MQIGKWTIVVSIFLLFSGEVSLAVGVTPEMQRLIRGATFEVVQKKPDNDPLSYEKPLPLELIPYLERSDAYRSVGTAFALGDNTYVTAGHVFTMAVASQYGPPALRSADGHVYTVDKVLRFSAHEDFVVFSLKDDPRPVPLNANRNIKMDDPVLAVGNALGEGIVIREGLFTSETPEAQDGRWKWIRFSAAASPGNSGGPLLDGAGHVIGIVIGKSPNENLNYALRIDQVLDASNNRAQFDERILRSMPLLRTTATYQFKDSFELPKAWKDFASAYVQILHTHNDKSRDQLLTANREAIFPKGSGAESILYRPVTTYELGVIAQNSDKRWEWIEPDYRTTMLASDGEVSVSSLPQDAVLLRVHRPANALDADFYKDSRASMDMALHGLGLTRHVGTDSVSITSLGVAQSDALYVDAYGRRWQRRTWAVPFLDVYLTALLLPTPDGYAGIIAYAPSLTLKETDDRLDWMARLVSVSYRGTLAQWQAFLSRREWLPESLKSLELKRDDKKQSWRIATSNAALTLTPDVLELTGDGVLAVDMGYVLRDNQLAWLPQAMMVASDESLKRYVKLVRRPQVPDSASRELRDDWQDLLRRRSPYSGMVSREADNSWTSKTVIDVASSQPQQVADSVVYVLTSHVENVTSDKTPKSVLDASRRAVEILEKGTGAREGATSAQTAPSGAEMDRMIDGMLESMISQFKEHGNLDVPDARSRHFEDDVREFVFTAGERNEIKELMRTDAASRQQASPTTPDTMGSESRAHVRKLFERVTELARYWETVAHVSMQRDNWKKFLTLNGLPESQQHSAQVQAAEAGWKTLSSQFLHKAPDGALRDAGQSLLRAYESERREMMGEISIRRKQAVLDFTRSAVGKCAAENAVASAQYAEKPEVEAKINPSASVSSEDYYPASSKRDGQEGLVVVVVHLDPTGCVVESAVLASSGFDAIDAAAVRYANEGLAFYPAKRTGAPVASSYSFRVNFAMSERQ